MAETASVYTAAVVGGGMGGRLSLRALTNSGRFRLVAACDLRPEICRDLERDFPGIRTFGDHRTMLRECPVDVVCVATFPASHREVVMDALELPLKGILVEKPLGHDSEAGREILAAIKARDLPMAVPHGLLVKRVPLEVIERVRKGDIGELKLIEIQCRGWDIINAGIHWLNFCVTLTGADDPPVEVLAGLDAEHAHLSRRHAGRDHRRDQRADAERGAHRDAHGRHDRREQPAARHRLPTRRHARPDRVLGMGGRLPDRQSGAPARRAGRAGGCRADAASAASRPPGRDDRQGRRAIIRSPIPRSRRSNCAKPPTSRRGRAA